MLIIQQRTSSCSEEISSVYETIDTALYSKQGTGYTAIAYIILVIRDLAILSNFLKIFSVVIHYIPSSHFT